MDDCVRQRVQGTIFTTTKLALRSYPKSLLRRMFASDQSMKQVESGTYFIDANPKVFDFILNFFERKVQADVCSLFRSHIRFLPGFFSRDKFLPLFSIFRETSLSDFLLNFALLCRSWTDRPARHLTSDER